MLVEIQRLNAIDNGITSSPNDWWWANTRLFWDGRWKSFWRSGPYLKFEGKGRQQDAVVYIEVPSVLPIRGTANRVRHG